MRKTLTRKQSESVLRVVIYIRISLDRDDQQSIENQHRESIAYAKAKGWTIVEVCEDVGKSAYDENINRPGFNKAMNMIKTRQADVLLVWKISRFIRRIRKFHIFLDQLLKAGGQFDSVTDNVDYMSASGEIILALNAGFAQLESEMKSDFAASWNEGRTAKGAVPQGPRPFGYDRIPRDKAPRNVHGHAVTLKVNPDEAEVIKLAAQSVLAGKSIRGIVRDLDGMKGSKGAPITTRGIKSALTNPTTAGLRAIAHEDETEYVEGCWEAILPRETWEAVRTVLSNPDRWTRDQDSDNQTVQHLLSGIMACGKDDCGRKIYSRIWKQAKHRHYRYTCFNCGNSATETVIDDAVKARLLKLVPQKEWQTLREQGQGYNPEVVEKIKADQRKLAAMWKAGEIVDLDTFQDMNKEVVERMARATGEQPLDLPDVDNLADSWDAMSLHDKRRVLNAVFGRIKLDPANGTRDTLSRLFTRRAV